MQLEEILLLSPRGDYEPTASNPVFVPFLHHDITVTPNAYVPIDDMHIDVSQVHIQVSGQKSISFPFYSFGMEHREEFEERYQETLSEDSLFLILCDIN